MRTMAPAALAALAAVTIVGLMLGGFSQGSAAPAAPASLAAIEHAARTSAPVSEARCWFHRWCGPDKCHRRLWCR